MAGTLEKLDMIEPLHIPIRFRPIDLILLALIALSIAFNALTYSELTDLQVTVARMQLLEDK